MSYRLKPLADQVIVITGASSGIGLATVREAAGRGARIVLAARNEAALEAEVGRLRLAGHQATHVVADVADPEAAAQIARAAVAAFGGFDTWVNNAGVGIFGRLDEVDDSDSRRLFDVNFWGLVYGTRVAAEHLRSKGGAIINLGSVAADLSFPLQGMYCASKHAIKGFTDSFRAEMLQIGAPVSVTLIKPSAINTPFAVHSRNYLSHEPKLPPPLYAPEDVAAAIVHAAAHGGRDIYVGGGGRLMSILNTYAPSLVDRAGALASRPLSSFDAPAAPDRADSLFVPGADGQVHGNTPHHVLRSSYTQSRLHPGIGMAAVAVAGVLGVALLGRSIRS